METRAEDMRVMRMKRVVWLVVGAAILVLAYFAFSVRREGHPDAEPPTPAPQGQGEEWEHNEINAFLHRRPKPKVLQAGKSLVELKDKVEETKEAIGKLAKAEKEEASLFGKLKALVKKNKQDDLMKMYPSLEKKQKEFERQSRRLLDKLEEENTRLKDREDLQKEMLSTKKPVLQNDMSRYDEDIRQSMMEELKALESFKNLSEGHKMELKTLRALVKTTEQPKPTSTGTPNTTSTASLEQGDLVRNASDGAKQAEPRNATKHDNATARGAVAKEGGKERKKKNWEQKELPDIFNVVEGVDIVDLRKPNTAFHKCVSLHVEYEPIICINSPQQDRPISSTLFRTGMWERRMLRVFTNLLHRCPECHVIDLGANLGVYTLTAAAQNRQALAVEPLPAAVFHLHKSVQLNGFYRRVILVKNALGEAKGVAELLYAHPTGDFGAAHTRQLNMTGLLTNNWSRGDRTPVRTISMDQLSQVPKFSTAVLKMDIQGAESAALRHSDQFFERLHIPYILTHWTVSMDTEGNCKDMDAVLRAQGYVPRTQPDGKDLSDKELEQDHEFLVWVKQNTTLSLGGVLLRN